MTPRYGNIVGWGKYVPDNVVTNEDLSQRMETSDEWIRARSGIRERRMVDDDETTATMATAAGRAALERAGLAPDDLDLIIVATSSPDYLTPPVSSQVQHALGAEGVGAMQLVVGCSGFVYGLVTAQQFVSTGACENVLVVGAELISRMLDWEDRGTSVLFGDGAGAVVLQATDAPCGVQSFVLGSDGSGKDALIMPSGGIACPPTHETLDRGLVHLRMDGRQVFRFATRILGEAVNQAIEKAGLSADDVDLFVPHQANIRIIELAARQAGIPREKVFVNIERYGNTSAASVPIALAEAFDAGRIRPGDTLALVAFGAGLAWASAIFQMGVDVPALEAARAAAATNGQG